MEITCSDTRTISDAFISICGHAVRISDIRPSYSTIDVVVDGQMIPGVGTVDVAIDSERVLITLISKNVSANTAVITFATEPNIIPPPTVEYTDTVKIYIKPWGWYSPGNVADKLIGSITDINGTIANYFSSITDYSYVKTDIATDGEYAVINIRLLSLQGMGIQTMAFPVAAVEAITALIWAIVALLLIGLIAYVVLVHESTGDKTPASTPDPKTVGDGTKKANDNAQANCLTGLPASPSCSDLSSYATCLDSVGIGINGTLEAVYPNSTDVKLLYDKYYGAYSQLTTKCNAGVPGETPSDIINQINDLKQQYTKDLTTTFDTLQKQYGKCKVPIFGQCADGILLAGGILVGVYILAKIFK